MQRNKNQSIYFFYIIFWLVWLLVQSFLSPYLEHSVTFHSSYDLIINFVLKGIIWVGLTFILWSSFKQKLQFTPQKIFNKHFSKEFWVFLAIFIIYLSANAYSVNPNFKFVSNPLSVNGGQIWGMVIGAGMFEELVFRAGFMNILLKKHSFWVTNIIQSLLFLAIHFPVYFITKMTSFDVVDNFATVIILGLVFGYVFYKTKNLWTTIILHAVWDSMMFFLFV